MDIKPPQPGNTPATETIAPVVQRAMVQKWQVNQIIDAVVTGNTARGGLLLDIQGTEAEVASPPPLALRAGDKLQLQLLQLTPRILFRILDSSTADRMQLELQKALRQVLPRQQPQGPLMANVAAIANHNLDIELPRKLLDMIQQVYQRLPRVEDVTRPDGLRQALQQTGQFLETQLARAADNPGQPIPDNQVRTSLLRLSEALRQAVAELPARPATPTNPAPLAENPARLPLPAGAPPVMDPYRQQQLAGYLAQRLNPAAVRLMPQPQAQLLPNIGANQQIGEILRILGQQVEGALKRITVHQLQQAQAENQLRPLWLFELPVRTSQGIDIFDLRIEPDQQGRRGTPGQQGNWIVTLAFDLKGLGPVRARIALQDQRISTWFWAENEKTAGLFNSYLDKLRSQFRQIGLDVGKLECRFGMPQLQEQDEDTTVVDEKA